MRSENITLSHYDNDIDLKVLYTFEAGYPSTLWEQGQSDTYMVDGIYYKNREITNFTQDFYDIVCEQLQNFVEGGNCDNRISAYLSNK